MAYTLTVKSYSGGTAILTLTSTSTISDAFQIRARAYSDNAGTQYVDGSGWVTPPSSSTEMDFTLSIANPGTYYVTVESDEPETILSLEPVVLPDNTPKTATQSQWEDLATRVNAKATITMTSTDPGEGSPLAANHYIAVYGTPPEFDYSTSEINTGARWINGSYIYKKTISTGALPNAGETNTPHSITNLSKVIKMEGYAYRSTDGKFIPLPFAGIASYNTTVDMSVVSGNIRLYVATDMSAFGESYVTLYYTKSA